MHIHHLDLAFLTLSKSSQTSKLLYTFCLGHLEWDFVTATRFQSVSIASWPSSVLTRKYVPSQEDERRFFYSV